MDLDILSKLLTQDINLLHQNSNNSVDWYEFVTNAGFSLSIAYLGIFIASFLYNLVYSYLQNFNFKNSFVKSVPNKNKIVFEKIKKCHICYWNLEQTFDRRLLAHGSFAHHSLSLGLAILWLHGPCSHQHESHPHWPHSLRTTYQLRSYTSSSWYKKITAKLLLLLLNQSTEQE